MPRGELWAEQTKLEVLRGCSRQPIAHDVSWIALLGATVHHRRSQCGIEHQDILHDKDASGPSPMDRFRQMPSIVLPHSSVPNIMAWATSNDSPKDALLGTGHDLCVRSMPATTQTQRHGIWLYTLDADHIRQATSIFGADGGHNTSPYLTL